VMYTTTTTVLVTLLSVLYFIVSSAITARWCVMSSEV
jgi:hypothetical protein